MIFGIQLKKKPVLRFFGIVLAMTTWGPSWSATSVTVNPEKQYQTLEGWGTSLCWWGNVVGGYSDQNRNAINGLLFAADTGLGLNIVRYNIGGGENPTHSHMQAGKSVPGFKPTEAGNYDWTQDANQRRILAEAKSLIHPTEFITEAFSNSPPYWMTISGCASGNSGGVNNLKPDYFDDFADYLTEVVKHFHDNWGITFRTLEPMNEPMVNWSINGAQEGCHIDMNLQDDLIREVKGKLDAKNLSGTVISASDETSIDQMLSSWNSYDAITKSYVAQINTHVYSGSKRAELKAAADKDGKRLWDSECDGSGAPAPFDTWTHNHQDIVPALDISYRITRDMRDMKAQAWIFWQVIENEATQINLNKNWGLLHADFNGGQNYSLTKKYYGVEQYTKFIRPGFIMIDINHTDAIAFMNPQLQKLVIVHRNSSDKSIDYVYDLSGFTTVGSSVEVYRTSSTENFSHKPDIAIANKVLSASAEAKSITTYVISGIGNGSVSLRSTNPMPTQKPVASVSNGNILWSYHSDKSEIVTVRLLDMRGHVLRLLHRGFMQADSESRGHVATSEFSAGAVYLSVESGDVRIRQRLILP